MRSSCSTAAWVPRSPLGQRPAELLQQRLGSPVVDEALRQPVQVRPGRLHHLAKRRQDLALLVQGVAHVSLLPRNDVRATPAQPVNRYAVVTFLSVCCTKSVWMIETSRSTSRHSLETRISYEAPYRRSLVT
jgi:hypothetical protein